MIRLSFLADQLGSNTGGARFVHGLINALLGQDGLAERFDEVLVLATQNEPVEALAALWERLRLVRRRFPARARGTALADAFGRLLPQADVAHGPFFYAFPHQARRTLVTWHDCAGGNASFHPPEVRRYHERLMTSVLPRCDAIVCTSDSVRDELAAAHPALAPRITRIYNGVAPIGRTAPAPPSPPRRPVVLAVGTIEPRKNYERILEAFEALLASGAEPRPELVVVGRAGWLCEKSVRRLEALAAAGHARWLPQADDATLGRCYQEATVFTYPSLYEGFGYPPFEAAYAGVPMVVSAASTIGEIWDGHARCVDPTDVGALLAGWRWALALGPADRAAIAAGQRRRAGAFTWRACAAAYTELYQRLARGPCPG